MSIIGEITSMHTNYPTWTPKYLACLQKITEHQNHTPLLSPPPCLAISICPLITALSSGSHFFLAFVWQENFTSPMAWMNGKEENRMCWLQISWINAWLSWHWPRGEMDSCGQYYDHVVKNTLPCDTLRVIVPSILLYSIHMHEKFIAEQRTSLRFF